MEQMTYIIYRGEPFDASAPLNFIPAKDSDELFDALRAKYPLLKTHSERMREAVIDFLMEEQAAESFSNNTSPTMPSLYDDSTAATSPNWQQSWPSMSSTTQSTPELLNMATPSFTNSPMFPELSQAKSLARQTSNATESAGATTPNLDQMTSVFALSTSEQPKQRIRRKMTEAEKVAYRKRRIVKACEKCSKRKRKCNHNQPEMETLPSTPGKATSRVTKSRATTAKPSQQKQSEQPSFASFETGMASTNNNDMLSFTPAEGFEDFSFALDEPLPDVDIDQMLQQFEQPATQYSNLQSPQQYSQDWTANNADWSLMSTPDSGQGDNMGGLMFPDSDLLFDGPLLTPDDQHDGQQQVLETYSTSAQQPTHTAHAHSAGTGSGGIQSSLSISSGDTGTDSRGGGTHDRAANGSANATRTFDNANARSNLSRSSQPSMENSATLIGSAAARAKNSAQMDGLSTDGQESASSQSMNGSRLMLRTARGQLDINANIRGIAQKGSATLHSGHESLEDGFKSGNRKAVSVSASAGEGASAVAAKANSAPSGKPSGLPHGSRHQLAPALSAPRPSSNAHPPDLLLSRSALTSRTSPFDREVPAYNGRPANIGGASLSTSPSTEMFMLKRRLPKALHSVVDRDGAAAVVTSPLLQTRPTNSSADITTVPSRQTGSGAYLRLDTDNYTRPSSASPSPAASETRSASGIASILSPAKKKQDAVPVHTRPSVTTTALASALPKSAAQTASAEAAKAKQHFSDARLAASKTGRYPCFESDTDTQRHRDHYGRASSSSLAASGLALVGAAVLLAALLASNVVTPSLLLLALLCPSADGSKRSHSFDRTLLSWLSHASMLPIVQCSVENSAWLAGPRLVTSAAVEKATSLWYARCDGWRMYQDERQDASDGALATGHAAPVQVA